MSSRTITVDTSRGGAVALADYRRLSQPGRIVPGVKLKFIMEMSSYRHAVEQWELYTGRKWEDTHEAGR